MPRAQAKSDPALEAEAMVQPATASRMGPLLMPAAEYLEKLTSFPPYFSIQIKLLVELDLLG